MQAAAVTDAAGFGLCLAGNGFMLSALPYTPHEVENARRQYELPPKVKTVVRCAKGQLGVCGRQHLGRRTPCRIPCGAGEGRNLPLHFWRHGRQWMSRPVAGKNKKGEGRPRAAVKKTNEKTILPYDDIPMPGAVAGAGGDFLSGEPQYRRTGQRRPAERRYGRALERQRCRGFSKESAEHIADGRGYSFAKLTYEKDVADILAKWETPAADMQARFDAVIDAQLADASTTQADRGAH